MDIYIFNCEQREKPKLHNKYTISEGTATGKDARFGLWAEVIIGQRLTRERERVRDRKERQREIQTQV